MLDLIRRDVGLKFVGEFASRAVFLCFFFYAGRKLGIVEFGSLSLALSSTYILSVIFLDPGLNLSTIQLLVSNKEQAANIASVIFTGKLLLCLPMMFSVWVLSRAFTSRLPSLGILFLAALYAFCTAVLEYLACVTNAFHRMDLEALLKLVNRLSIVVFCALVLQFYRATSVVLWAMWIATLAACVLALILLNRQLISIRLGWNSEILKQSLKTGLPIAGTMIVAVIYLKWDLLVLSYFNIGPQEIGWYAGAFKITEAFSALPTILGTGLFPLMVQLRVDNEDALGRILRTATKAVLLFSIPAAAAISFFSRPIITLVYGSAFGPGAKVLAVLIWCIVPMFLYFYLIYVNVAAGHASFNLLAGCAALGTGLIANTVLVPRLGFIGAAWAALVANSSFALLAAWKLCVLFRKASIAPMLVKMFAAGGLMLIVGLCTPATAKLQFSLALLVYVGVLTMAGVLDGDDLSLFIRLFHIRLRPSPQA